jgi:thiol-disulfide isomerase/thioredoxin
MLPLGTQAPEFVLPDVVTGKPISLESLRDKKAFLIMFICRHCPYVKHIGKELARIGRDYGSKGVGIVAITSNDPEAYPEDSPVSTREMAVELGFSFSICFDESQEIARAFKAACTPDFYVFDNSRRLVYRGQLDDSRPGNDIPVTGRDVRGALDAVLHERPVDQNQKPSIGCNIKWKPGNEPGYFG